MNKAFLGYFLLFCFVASNSVLALAELGGNSNIISNAQCIESSYSNIINGRDIETNNKLFYSCFPKTFENLVAIFGYSDTDKPGPLANKNISYDYIDYYFNYAESNNNYNALLKLGVNGRWQLDNIAYVQFLIKELLTIKPQLTVKVLKSFNDRDLSRFWLFYLDGQHQVKSLPDEIKAVEVMDKRVYESAMFEYRKLIHKGTFGNGS